MINTGGEKLWPEDLEAVLTTIEGVIDIAVTSVEDSEWGQRVVALVVGNGANHDEEIRAIAAERLGPWAKPKEIRYVVAIPRTNTAKFAEPTSRTSVKDRYSRLSLPRRAIESTVTAAMRTIAITMNSTAVHT